VMSRVVLTMLQLVRMSLMCAAISKQLLAMGKKFGEILQGMHPDLVGVRLHFVLGRLLFRVVVALDH
jgi:hypothetical protein